jgi:hypothetical protein
VVQQGNFSAWLDPWGKDEWALGISETISGSGAKDGFRFTIRNEGISIEGDGLGDGEEKAGFTALCQD